MEADARTLPAAPSFKREAVVLYLLIPLSWLAVTVHVVAACRVAAHADRRGGRMAAGRGQRRDSGIRGGHGYRRASAGEVAVSRLRGGPGALSTGSR
jgi:hypothetical protein